MTVENSLFKSVFPEFGLLIQIVVESRFMGDVGVVGGSDSAVGTSVGWAWVDWV